MTTFKKLVDKFDPDLVMIRFAELYKNNPDFSIQPFREVFQNLKNMSAVPQDNYELVIEEIPDLIDKTQTFTDVSALDKDSNARLGLDFYEWKHWLACPISEKSLQDYSELDIICHCLWEMTFFGFKEEQIRDVKEELEKRVKSIEDGTAKFVDWKTIKEKLELDAWDDASNRSLENFEKTLKEEENNEQ